MTASGPLPIEQYALIGNLHTAALVGRNGSIDWLCLPYFDSGACFSRLLGTADHGYWQIEPVGDYRVTRHYRENTLVLETMFTTAEGSVKLIDAMTLEAGRADVLRVVEGLSGVVALDMTLRIRLDYGSVIPWIRYQETELIAIGGPDKIRVYGNSPLSGDNAATQAHLRVRRGERYSWVLNWHPSFEKEPPRLNDPGAALDGVTRWWADWSAKSRYEGRWKADVQRSLITLKALTFAPSGGIVAAPTTSLPEALGGVRNWDYRFCWLRDATFTLYSLITAGYIDEARDWRLWLLRAVAGSSEKVRVLYGIRGERRLPELTLPWLPGYEASQPVRIGNAASEQLQLDVYGELMDAFHVARRSELETLESAWELERDLVDQLETLWPKPDEGIWEVRGPRRPFTHSKVMCWVAFDRAIKAVEGSGLPGPVERWCQIRAQIHEEVCREGFNSKLGSFVQYYGADHPDASLLMIPLVGFLPPTDPRVRSTIAVIEKELLHDGFIRRYPVESSHVDGLPPGEGTFLACSFWFVDNLVLTGRKAEAEALFERLLKIRNDVGLLAEEYDIHHRRQVGNFPQAFSHVSLINSARNLSGSGGPADDRKSNAARGRPKDVRR